MPMQNEGYVWENEVIHDPEDCVKPVIEINISKLRELHAATTQGEWIASIGMLPSGDECGDFVPFAEVESGDGEMISFCEQPDRYGQSGNCRFIAAAHNIWPALLDELERLRAENAALKGNPNE